VILKTAVTESTYKELTEEAGLKASSVDEITGSAASKTAAANVTDEAAVAYNGIDWQQIAEWDSLLEAERFEVLQGIYEDWFAGLSGYEKEAISRYLGTGYRDINNYLRGLPIDGDAGQILEDISTISAALGRAELDCSMRVQRMIRAGYETSGSKFEYVERIKSLKPGDTETVTGFLSTTYSAQATFGTASADWHMDIVVPKGVHGVKVDDFPGAFVYEREVLILPGYKLKVISVDAENKRTYFELLMEWEE
jgi:hypothetical protein